MKLVKRLTAVLLSLALMGTSLVSGLALPVGAEEVETQESEVVATNSIGRVLSSALESEETEDVHLIHGVTIVDGVATMEFNKLTDTATAVVGLFDEETDEMLLSDSVEVYAEENTATITFDPEKLPKYFVVKVFLLGVDMQPLCKAFICNDYTASYQEFLSKTTDDFSETYVINLDESENFVVVTDSAVVVTETEANVLVSCDEENGIYVFENVDEEITSLVEGDIFYYTSEESIITIKVGSIVVDRDTATITEAEAEVEEIFDYIKLEKVTTARESDFQEAQFGEGITYLGEGEDETGTASVYARGVQVEGSTSDKWEFFDLKRKLNDLSSVSGNISMQLTITARVFYDVKLFGKDYIDAALFATSTIKGNIKFEGEVKLDSDKITLVNVPIYIGTTGLKVNVKISPVLEASASIELGFKLENKSGFTYTTNSGLSKINDKDGVYEPYVENEIKVKVGFQIELKLVVIEVVNIIVTGEIYAEAIGQLEYPSNSNSTTCIHSCNACIDGDIYIGLTVSAQLKFGWKDSKWEWTPVNYTTELLRIKASDFYWSLTNKEFGFSECPHKLYKVTFVVLSGGSPIANAKIGNLTTDAKGQASAYYVNGRYNFNVTADGHYSTSVDFVVSSEKKAVSIYMNKMAAETTRNVAPLGNAYASGDAYSAGRAVTYLNDGDMSTGWQTNIGGAYGDSPGIYSTASHMGVSFTSPVWATGITIHAAGISSEEGSDHLVPGGYQVKYYDGKQWHSINTTVHENTLVYSFPSPKILYNIRLEITKRYKYSPVIYEILVDGSISNTSTKPVYLSSQSVALSENTIEATEPNTPTLMSTTFEHAVAEEEYLLVVSSSNEFEKLISAENLLYIAQCTAESETVTFTYPKITSTDTSYVFIFGQCEHNIESTPSRDATCSQLGELTYFCEYCEDTYAVPTELDPENHSYDLNYTVDTQPSTSSVGSMSRHCIYCDTTTDVTELPCVGKFVEVSLSNKKLTLQYKVERSQFEEGGYADPYIVVELGGTQTEVTEYTTSGDYYVFTYNVHPSMMNKTVYATLYISFNDVAIQADTAEYNLDEEFWSVLNIGAQIRENATNSSAYDMRFVSALDADFASENIKDIDSLGVLLARADQLEAEGLTTDDLTLDLNNDDVVVKSLSASYLNNTALASNGYYMYYSTITGITEDAFDREYVAVAYCTIDGTTYYSNAVTRCVNDGLAS